MLAIAIAIQNKNTTAPNIEANMYAALEYIFLTSLTIDFIKAPTRKIVPKKNNIFRKYIAIRIKLNMFSFPFIKI